MRLRLRLRRWTAGVAAAALLVALPACGKQTDESARAAGLTPANAIGFLTLSLDPSIDQKRNLFELARKFPDAQAREDFDNTRNDLLQRMLDDAGLDYRADVEPWLGSEVAVAVLPAPSGGEPLVAVFLEQDDEDAARAAMDKANQRAVAEGEPPAEYRLVDDFVVVSGDDDPARNQAVLDAIEAQADVDEGDLASSARFAEVVDELHGDRLLLGWVDTQEAFRLVEELMPAGELDLGVLLKEAGPTAFDFHTERSAVVFQGVARATQPAEGGEPRLTEQLPASSFGALTVFDLRTVVRDSLEAMRREGVDPLAEIKAETGVDIEADVLSWMGGEAVVVSAPAPGSRAIPDFALVVAPDDRAAAEAGIARVVAGLEQGLGGPLERRQVAGTTAYMVPEEDEGMQPAMALFADRFVVATTPAYLERLATDANPALGDSPAYQSVLGRSESSATRFQLVVDIDAVREAYEGVVPAEERGGYETDTKQNVEPLDAFGVVARRDGDFERIELKLTFD